MIVLGIDPGLSALGYGVLRKAGGKIDFVDSGTIRTTSKTPFPKRLHAIHQGVRGVIETHSPGVLVMEKPIYCQNVKTALILGQVGGAAILAATEMGVDLLEFTPLEVKKAITGKGRAGKEQVQKMVKVLLGRGVGAIDEHASDALACALCYLHSEKLLKWRAQA